MMMKKQKKRDERGDRATWNARQVTLKMMKILIKLDEGKGIPSGYATIVKKELEKAEDLLKEVKAGLRLAIEYNDYD